ncbi:hypothetical protein FBY06_110111 [Pseudomonas sp. SJZ085]|jgi:hypothetical protein|nr:hypothetical protein FBX99_11050 [Pseudomonas sp. SJZ074]TWC30134.1 hypothetical protein FBY02_11985 [Pseudomonas sp. SJZ078]TWC37933.1 hypothetical protein FBY06_110111 [Pseudomonas sp. SJZ085]TWC51086.1 hypothetical protein FBY11_11850 [Pseudomonas sp. SJZ124]TWC86445.1 hypothetical protein FBY09_11885 [Pseudomonas sp. SJZ101]SDU86478.1 hypothetical protein SAMN04490183_0762 [Pseudomonas corrugata]
MEVADHSSVQRVRPNDGEVATDASCLLVLKHSVRRRNQPASVDEMKRLKQA